MALPAIPDAAIRLHASADDWREAVAVAGAALARTGAAEPRYTDDMIRMIQEHGPYVVIAPGLALAHARPGPAVLTDGLAVVTLATPVAFGHPHNDPVRVVLALAAHSPAQHLPLVAEIANVFNDPNVVDGVAEATTPEQVRELLGASA